MESQEYDRRREVVLGRLQAASPELRDKLENALISLYNVCQEIDQAHDPHSTDNVVADYIHYDLAPAATYGIILQINEAQSIIPEG